MVKMPNCGAMQLVFKLQELLEIVVETACNLLQAFCPCMLGAAFAQRPVDFQKCFLVLTYM